MGWEDTKFQLLLCCSGKFGGARLLAITLQVHVREPITVVEDEARMIQVIMNLLDNAICYTHPGGRVSLTVEVRQSHAYLAISDTRIGIATEHLPHIFERFYRGDLVQTRTGGGSSGLGLAIVEWVVRAHGGVVAVGSQVGRGSSFSVTLPLARTALLEASAFPS